MNIHIHIHQDKEILELLLLIIKNQKTIMSQNDQMAAALTEIETATTAIAARLQALIDAGAGNITDDQLAELQTDADALKAMGNPS